MPPQSLRRQARLGKGFGRTKHVVNVASAPGAFQGPATRYTVFAVAAIVAIAIVVSTTKEVIENRIIGSSSCTSTHGERTVVGSLFLRITAVVARNHGEVLLVRRDSSRGHHVGL